MNIRVVSFSALALIFSVSLSSQSFAQLSQKSNCVKAPIFDRHVGRWEGVYRYYNEKGELIDTHKSILKIKRECNTWEQSNTYIWDNGKKVTFLFPGSFSKDGTLTMNTPRLSGKAWESQDSIILQWKYKDNPGSKNFEMINFVSANKRVRSWQLTKNGNITGYVSISETRASK